MSRFGLRYLSSEVLADVTFRRFFTGQTISLVGDQITLIALPLTAILVLHADAAEMGYLTAAALLPNLLFSMHAGAAVDRRGRWRQTMIAADVGRAALLASIPIADLLGILTMAQLYAVGFAAGLLSVFFYVSYSTLFTSIVSRGQLMQANSLTNGSRAFSFVAGPSLGGLLVQIATAPFALAVDALSFVGSALYLSSIHPQEPDHARRPGASVTAGIRFILRTPALRASMLGASTMNLFNFMFAALFVLYANRELDVQPGALGLVLGAGAVGGVIGSVVTGRISRRIGVGPAYVLGMVLFPAPLILVPLAGGPHWLVLAMLFLAEFGAGLGVMLLDITIGAIFQAMVPDGVRARFTGAFMTVNYGVRPVGSLVGGLLGAAIGLRPTLWIATIGALLGILPVVLSPFPRMRELPDEVSFDE